MKLFLFISLLVLANGVQLSKRTAAVHKLHDLVHGASSSSATLDALVEMAAKGDPTTLNTINDLVKNKLIVDLKAAISTRQGELNSAFAKLKTCADAVPTCYGAVTTLKNDYDTKQAAVTSHVTTLTAEKSVTPSCPALSFAGESGADEATAYLTVLKTAIDTEVSQYNAAMSTYTTLQAAATSAKTAFDTKRGACDASCNDCQTSTSKEYNDLVTSTKSLLTIQKQDFQVYMLILCVATESAKAGGGDATVLSTCRSTTADDREITYTFPTAPTFTCGHTTVLLDVAVENGAFASSGGWYALSCGHFKQAIAAGFTGDSPAKGTGQQVTHSNQLGTVTATNLDSTKKLSAGTYTVLFAMGSYDNMPACGVSEIKFANLPLSEATEKTMPYPGLGEFNLWKITWKVPAGDSRIGSDLSFSLTYGSGSCNSAVDGVGNLSDLGNGLVVQYVYA